MKNYQLPLNLEQEIDRLDNLIKKYKAGEISAKELKGYRVPFGVYGQREEGTFMMRIRCTGGLITPNQLKRIARLAKKYAASHIHITTRQEIQLHYLKLDDLVEIMKQLKEVGLASRGGGGNTIRNLITDEQAGIAEDEAFDVTPYTVALTTRLISEEDSWTLPRKLKIAFSGSAKDRGFATVTDLGFIAKYKNGERGFKVYVAGGFGSKAQLAKVLFDFIEEDKVYAVARAVKNIFAKYGNRKNKYAARLRFLWHSLGEDEFRKRFAKEYKEILRKNYSPLKVEPVPNKAVNVKNLTEKPNGQGCYQFWLKRFAKPQKQKGLYSVLLGVELGFVKNEEAEKIAEFFEQFGQNTIRLTKEQNFLIRNIPKQYLPNIYNFLQCNLSNFNRPVIYGRLISCAGASTCKLGICLSRGLARAIMRSLSKSDLELDIFQDFKLNISGCPNSCGQHQTADLGFFGKALRKKGRLYPAYNVVCGATIEEGRSRYGETITDINAKDLPKATIEFLREYLKSAEEYASFKNYINNGGKEQLKQIFQKYKDIPLFEEDKNYYFDWEAEEAFSLAGRSKGECSAGLFDLIEVDLENIKKSRDKLKKIKESQVGRERLISELIFYSARMLLITRAVEPKTEKDVYNSFKKYFIESGLVDESFRLIIKAAQTGDYQYLIKNKEQAFKLADRVKSLYENMDKSFNFKTEENQRKEEEIKQKESKKKESEQKPKMIKDLRGVACPMNFVKTKIELAKLAKGDILEVWLDSGEPIENVPASVKSEGHKIIKQEKIDNYWGVVIEKK